jgi:hypothetical protein
VIDVSVTGLPRLVYSPHRKLYLLKKGLIVILLAVIKVVYFTADSNSGVPVSAYLAYLHPIIPAPPIYLTIK